MDTLKNCLYRDLFMSSYSSSTRAVLEIFKEGFVIGYILRLN